MADLGVSKQNRFDLLFVVADTGQMRDRIQFCCVLNALDEIVGQLTRRATGAVSHADKVRHVRLQDRESSGRASRRPLASSGERTRTKTWENVPCMMSVICMSQRLSSFLPRLSVNSSRNATPRYRRLQLPKRICNHESLDSAVTFGCGARTGLATFYGVLTSVSWRLAALLPGFLLKSPARWQSSSARRCRWKRAKLVVD